MGTSEPIQQGKATEGIAKWCIYPDCHKTKKHDGPWEVDDFRTQHIKLGTIPSMFGYCDEHNPNVKKAG